MEESSGSSEVSFFELAKRYEMSRSRRRRWRDQRDTLPARRRRRRERRHDFSPSREYYPMEIDSREANRGIRSRLLGAMASGLLTLICLVSIFLAPVFTLGSIFALTVAIGSLGLSVSLALSARDEEIVHEVAGQLTAGLEDPPKALTEDLQKPLNFNEIHPYMGVEDGDVGRPPAHHLPR